jgi:hypothetical protein
LFQGDPPLCRLIRVALIGEAATAQRLEFQFQSNMRRSRPVLSVVTRPCCSCAKASPTSLRNEVPRFAGCDIIIPLC